MSYPATKDQLIEHARSANASKDILDALQNIPDQESGRPNELSKAVAKLPGWLGVPLAVFSLYGGPALLLEESYQRMVLPLSRRGRARASLEGSFAHQIQQAELEPGVRRQL